MGNGYPRVLTNLTEQEIEDYGATSNSSEEHILTSLGLTEQQVKRAKKFPRWRFNFDKGRAKFALEYNKKLALSTEPSIQKVIAEHTLPKLSDIEDGIVIQVDAPEWFLKALKKGNK